MICFVVVWHIIPPLRRKSQEVPSQNTWKAVEYRKISFPARREEIYAWHSRVPVGMCHYNLAQLVSEDIGRQ